MSLFVDTSVWSLAFRRDAVAGLPQVLALRRALDAGEISSPQPLPPRRRAIGTIDALLACCANRAKTWSVPVSAS